MDGALLEPADEATCSGAKDDCPASSGAVGQLGAERDRQNTVDQAKPSQGATTSLTAVIGVGQHAGAAAPGREPRWSCRWTSVLGGR